jgi:hypothetical protein
MKSAVAFCRAMSIGTRWGAVALPSDSSMKASLMASIARLMVSAFLTSSPERKRMVCELIVDPCLFNLRYCLTSVAATDHFIQRHRIK